MNIFQSVTKIFSDAGEVISSTASATGQAVIGSAVSVGEAVSDTASVATQTVTGKATEIGGAIANTASQISEVAVGTVVAASESIGNAAIEAGRVTAETLAKTGSEAATQAAKLAGVTSNSAFQVSHALVEKVTKTGAEAIALAMSQIVQDCTVPAFLLPTGSSQQNFKCTFYFDQVVAKLTSGMLVRPQVQVWAGRVDIDRLQLAQIFKEDFICQFNAAREQAIEANQNAYADKIVSLKHQQEQSGQEASHALQNTTYWAVTALLLMFFVANPIFNLIFFGLAISGGVEGMAKGLNCLRLSLAISGDEEKLKLEQQKLEADFDSKNEAFIQAVNNMTVHVHPVLQELVTLFSELDSIPFFPVNIDSSTTQYPLVDQLLTDLDYRRNLPIEYLPLLELIQQ